MNFKVVFRPEIEEDILSGYSWYESKSAGLGSEFLQQFYEFAKKYP